MFWLLFWNADILEAIPELVGAGGLVSLFWLLFWNADILEAIPELAEWVGAGAGGFVSVFWLLFWNADILEAKTELTGRACWRAGGLFSVFWLLFWNAAILEFMFVEFDCVSGLFSVFSFLLWGSVVLGAPEPDERSCSGSFVVASLFTFVWKADTPEFGGSLFWLLWKPEFLAAIIDAILELDEFGVGVLFCALWGAVTSDAAGRDGADGFVSLLFCDSELTELDGAGGFVSLFWLLFWNTDILEAKTELTGRACWYAGGFVSLLWLLLWDASFSALFCVFWNPEFLVTILEFDVFDVVDVTGALFPWNEPVPRLLFRFSGLISLFEASGVTLLAAGLWYGAGGLLWAARFWKRDKRSLKELIYWNVLKYWMNFLIGFFLKSEKIEFLFTFVFQKGNL